MVLTLSCQHSTGRYSPTPSRSSVSLRGTVYPNAYLAIWYSGLDERLVWCQGNRKVIAPHHPVFGVESLKLLVQLICSHSWLKLPPPPLDRWRVSCRLPLVANSHNSPTHTTRQFTPLANSHQTRTHTSRQSTPLTNPQPFANSKP